MPSAPLSVSSQPRKKVKSSGLNKQAAGEADKENAGIPSDDDGVGWENDEHSGAFSITDLAFPQTPAVRIPLEDLIGNTEDAFNCPQPLATPGDHVIWHNGPASSDPSVSAHGTQKSRKRARSSSPSSQLEKSTHFEAEGQKDPMDLNGMHKSLRTPNNDPTQDLWNRYMSANISRQDNPEFVLPSFAHLGPSSPQTPSTTSKDGGLRRTVSCGIEWPTSKPKRRKIDAGDSHSRTKNIFAASRREILAQNLAKNSRVGVLVDKIQESLNKRQRVDDEPSSSSPLPGRHSQMPATQASPTRSPTKTNGNPIQTKTALVLQETAELQQSNPRQSGGAVSEFEDDDLDVEFFENAEKDLQPGASPRRNLSPISEIPPDNAGQPSRPQLEGQVVPSNKEGPQECRFEQKADAGRQNVDQSFDDDFDDEDDTFAEELQDLADKVDSQNQQNKISGVDGPALMAPILQEKEDMDDVFDDDDDLWAQVADEIAQGKTVIGSTSQKIMNKAIKRYLILDTFEDQYKTANGKTRPQKMLSLKDERSGLLYIVLLRQSWYDTRCTKKSYVHVIGDFDRSGQCIVDDADNMIILHPDHLISATVVGDSFTCTRRAALQDRVKATSRATPLQVYGHILHEMFGEALRFNLLSTESFADVLRQILPNYLEDLYEIGVSESDATEYLLGKTPDLIGWASVFVGDTIMPDAVIRDRNGALVPTAINKLLELEEHVWSPMYGLKGNVDATVQVQMHLPEEANSKTLVVPLELKTGKRDNVEAHRSQTALYTLLLSDRYDVNVTCGVLYYLETSKTFRIASIRNEIRHMIIERNELACYVHDKLDLPPMLKKSHLCKACYSKTECFTYHKLIEGGDIETSGVGETFNELVGHLKPAHAEFFKKWDGLLTKEERDTMKFRRELWTMLSTERQAVGRCFANVVIEPGSAQENKGSTKINRFSYTFVKHKSECGFSFMESQITIGEPIVISDERGHFNLASGYVTNVRPTRVVVAVDRRLQNAYRKHAGFDPETNQVFTGLMESHPNGSSSSSAPNRTPKLYRIDKDEFANGMATARNNLIRIMEKDLFKARELRQLIIDGMAPSFRPIAAPYVLSGPASQQAVNEDQRHAIEKVMAAKDYALVLGMPGTGKTTTIAHIIRALVSQNKSVLLASYTHTAVDNIVLKIQDDNIPILRIGAVSKVHPQVQSFADLTGIPKKTMTELHKSWHESKVVATTCLGINHSLFNARTFDYCIVDEASQITLPVCLGPIRHANTFILVGDHYQLPPLVQNKEAQEGGLNVSLFKLLSDTHPESVVNLEHQYRMAEDIMVLSSQLVYNGRLKCGNDTVAQRTLHIPNLEAGLAAHHHTPSSLPSLLSNPATSPTAICLSTSSTCYLAHALSPLNRTVFLNTDPLGPSSHELSTAQTNRITNPLESLLTAHLVTVLLRSGLAPASIGVITFYRSQLSLLRADIKSHAGSAAGAEIEMHTADKYQGRDKEVVVLSCVRSNSECRVGELLRDWRRVNVAVTRARSKLIVIGSKDTLQGSGVPVLQGIVDIMAEKGWVFDLDAKALWGHRFECVGTQGGTQGLTSRSALDSGETGEAVMNGRGSPQKPSGSPRKPSTASPNSGKKEKSRAPLQQRTPNPLLPSMESPTHAMATPLTSPKPKPKLNHHAAKGGYLNKPFKKPSKVVNGKTSHLQNMLERTGNSIVKDILSENENQVYSEHNLDTVDVDMPVPVPVPVVVDLVAEDKENVPLQRNDGLVLDSSGFEIGLDVDSEVLGVLRVMEMEGL